MASSLVAAVSAASVPTQVALVVTLAAVSLCLANAVAGCLARARDQRVEDKCARLAAGGGAPLPPSGASSISGGASDGIGSGGTQRGRTARRERQALAPSRASPGGARSRSRSSSTSSTSSSTSSASTSSSTSSTSSTSSASSAASRGAVPVTIVTGFLGAGKTVLLNRLLSSPAGHRVCVIENEAGAVSIDHSLLSATTRAPGGATVMVLKNGCMCCSATSSGDELERSLDRLLQVIDMQAATPGAQAFDYVVIETSGLVDPAPILQAFFRADVSARYFIDAVVTVVDAKHIRYHLDDAGLLSRSKEAGRQVAYADAVLLNKVDLVTPDERAAAITAIRRINPAVTILPCSYADVDTRAVLDLRRFDVARAAAIDPSALIAADAPPGTPRPRGRHSGEIVAVTIAAPLRGRAADEDALKAWLQDTVTRSWRDLYRVKGLLWVSSRDRRGRVVDAPFVVHGVHEELHGALLDEPPPPFEPALVVIGRRLDAAALLASFLAAVPTTPCAAALPPPLADGAAAAHSHHHTHGAACAAADDCGSEVPAAASGGGGAGAGPRHRPRRQSGKAVGS